MTPERARNLAQRLIAKHGSRVAWTRTEVTTGGADGTVTTGEPLTFQVAAVPLGPESYAMVASEWWQTASVRLMVSAKGLTFDPDPVSGEPEVDFHDVVTWAGRNYRVVGVEPYRKGSPTTQERPYLFLVALAA